MNNSSRLVISDRMDESVESAQVLALISSGILFSDSDEKCSDKVEIL